MALRFKITAFEHAALNDALKGEYKLGTDGQYTLDMPGVFVTDKDPQGLLSALQAERDQHASTKAHLTRLETERDEAKRAADLAKAQKDGDAAALQKLFEDERNKLQQTFQKQLEEQKAAIEASRKQAAEQMRLSEANKLAAELFGVKAPIMVPHILNNLSVSSDEIPTIQFLNGEGKPDPTLNAESYKKSLLTNPLFADMVVVSKASGGSANDGKGKIPATTKEDGSPKTFKDYTPGELMRIKREQPELWSKIKPQPQS